MSTRANIVLQDEMGNELWFYRHSDGYPEGTMPTLNKFLDWVKQGRIRDNVEQAGGWLILIGAEEYKETHLNPDHPFDSDNYSSVNYEGFCPSEPTGGIMGWKAGAYEPAVGEHGDIEFIYYIDLQNKKITYYSV